MTRFSSHSRDVMNKRSRALWAVVTILGAAVFAVSFGSPVPLGFPVRVAVLAAAVAAVGLLPAQGGRGWVVVALAVSGFLDAVTVWVAGGESGWALTVIVGLDALQCLAALGALLQQPLAAPPSDSQPSSDPANYAQLVAAYQAYAAQYQYPAGQYAPMGRADAQGAGTAQSPARDASVARGAQDSFEALQARYAQHAAVAANPESRGSAVSPPMKRAADPGMPGTDRSAPEAIAYQGRWENPRTSGSGSAGQ